jgi:flagellar capping protein FliD
MQEQIKELIKKYNTLLSGYQELISEYEAKGLENLNFEDTEYYGAYLGKVEILEVVIEDLKKFDTFLK